MLDFDAAYVPLDGIGIQVTDGARDAPFFPPKQRVGTAVLWQIGMTEAKRRQVARNRWFVVYTLMKNPVLQFRRRSHRVGLATFYTSDA